jgi:signal transduction histidine kinase
VSAIYAWLSRHPKLVDGVLALVLTLISAGSGFGPNRRWIGIPVTLLLVIPVVFRRKHPTGAFAAAIAAGALEIVAGIGPVGADFAIVILLYTVAAYRPRRVSVPALVICLLGSALAVAAWTPRIGLLKQIFVGSVMFGGTALIAWVLGDSMHYRRGYLVALEDRAARLEAERDAQAQVAAAAERARIARELHDVIAHNVSVMVVQADGAGYALQTDPERARQALAAISRTGRQALTEMRRLLGVLRDGDRGAGLAPQPGLDQLRELLDQARTAGMSVSLTVQGPARPLDEGAELAAYRVVQESLTNTRKHGGLAVAAAVTLRYAADGLLVQVTDDGRGGAAAEAGAPAGEPAGHGLTGMRERIAMYGGTVQAGPLPGGGFQVSALLPLPEPDLVQGTSEAGPQLGRPELAGPGPSGRPVRQGDAA